MSDSTEAAKLFALYGLGGLHSVSDPTCDLYRAYGLSRGKVHQLFGRGVWLRGITAALFEGHGIGRLSGDGFRMPGVFLFDRGTVVAERKAATAADRPDYLSIVTDYDQRKGAAPALTSTG
jgi:hypothetical protein